MKLGFEHFQSAKLKQTRQYLILSDISQGFFKVLPTNSLLDVILSTDVIADDEINISSNFHRKTL